MVFRCGHSSGLSRTDAIVRLCACRYGPLYVVKPAVDLEGLPGGVLECDLEHKSPEADGLFQRRHYPQTELYESFLSWRRRNFRLRLERKRNPFCK